MSEQENLPNEPQINKEESFFNKVKEPNPMINLILVLITFVTTVIAGAQWVLGYGVLDVSQLYHGLPYAFSILFMLGTHEFGHYFASLAHKVKVTLPYFIPFPSIEGFLNFGTMGAVIKTKSPIQNKTALFDIGIAGPVAGFIASIGLVIYGFSTLPGKDYILGIHPDYDTIEYGAAGVSLIFGDNILFSVLRDMFANSPDGFIPPMNEIYHYPYLCVGWFGLFVTALNLIPVGQLDGGHIMYAMFGSKVQKIVAWLFMLFMLVWGGLGILTSFYDLGFNGGWSGWIFWALILFFIIKVPHPPVPDETPISTGRVLFGLFGILIFILTFSPSPIIIQVTI